MHCNTLNERHSSAVLSAISRCSISRCSKFNTPHHTASYCNTLQHTAAHCNTLQHTATHCNTLYERHTAVVLQAVSRCPHHGGGSMRMSSCNVNIAVRCIVLHCVAVCCGCNVSIAICCSVLQCVAVATSALQCVTVCSVAAVYCSVLQLQRFYYWYAR